MTAYDTALLALSAVKAYYPLDDAGGATSFRDATSGNIGAIPFNGTNATLGNASIMPGDASTCLHHTSTANDWGIVFSSMTTAGKADLQQPGPIAFVGWIKPDQVTGDVSGNQFLFGQSGGPTFLLQKSEWKAGLQFGNYNTLNLIVPNAVYMVAATYDLATVSLYINGVLYLSTAVTTTTVVGAGQSPAGSGTLTVASTTGFVGSGALVIPGITGAVTYTGTSGGNTFTGCTGGTGTATNGGTVAPAVKPNTQNMELGGILGAIGFQGYMQKFAFLGSAPSAAQIQNLYIIGAASLAETAGLNLNTYPFSRQAVATNSSRKSITLTNISDTPMFITLGATAAAVNQGILLPANGVRPWTSSTWKGPIQVIHSNFTGSKLLLIQEV